MRAVPTLISNALLVVFALVVFGPATPHPRGAYNAPATGVLGSLLYSFVLMIVSLPGIILTYRYARPTALSCAPT